LEINIWLIQSKGKPRAISLIDRNKYFANLKALKYSFPKLLIHPILQLGSTKVQKQYLKTDSARTCLQILLNRRKVILEQHRIPWDSYHIISKDFLELLHHATSGHPCIQRLINQSEINATHLGEAYYTSFAWIYCIFNIDRNIHKVYIGQTGMKRRKRLDRNRSWQDLERAPLQRMREHITSALDSSQRNSRCTATLYKQMRRDPHNWIMIPMARIPISLRRHSLKIEDRWWKKYFPNTYNDLPPNSITTVNNSNKAQDQQVIDKIANMTYTDWINRISRSKVNLTMLEVIAGFNRFNKKLPPTMKEIVLQIIKKKCRHNGLQNFRATYNLRIPLQTRTQAKKIRQRINTLQKRLNCPGPVKEYINQNTRITYMVTTKLIDITRMDRAAAEDIKYDDIKNSTLEYPQP